MGLKLKKILFFVMMLFITISCSLSEDKSMVYGIIFEVHYPSRIDTLTVIDTFRYKPYVYSDRGTNIIYSKKDKIIETTAPINIIKNVKLKDITPNE